MDKSWQLLTAFFFCWLLQTQAELLLQSLSSLYNYWQVDACRTCCWGVADIIMQTEKRKEELKWERSYVFLFSCFFKCVEKKMFLYEVTYANFVFYFGMDEENYSSEMRTPHNWKTSFTQAKNKNSNSYYNWSKKTQAILINLITIRNY